MPEKLKENLYNYPNNPNPINPDYPLEAILTEAHMQNTITSDMVSIVAAKGKIPIGNPADSYKLDSSWLGIDPDASYAVDATTTRKGIIEIATEAEAKTGTDTERAVTPAGVKASILQNTPKATTAQSGVVTLTNLIDNSQDKAVTPYAIQNYLSSSNFSRASYTGYGITKFASTTNVAKVLTDSATKPVNTLKNDTNYKEQAVDPYSLYNYVSNNTMYFNVNKQSVGGIIFRDLSEDDTATRVTATERARLYVNKDNGSTYLKVNNRTVTLLDNAGNAAFPVSVTASTSVITPLIKQSNGNAPKLGTKKIGDTTKPIYIASDGTISECNTIDNVNNATTASKLGSVTVGNTNKPIYLNGGSPTAISGNIGDANIPVYIKDGAITSTGKSFANYLPLSGGSVTGKITFDQSATSIPHGTWVPVTAIRYKMDGSTSTYLGGNIVQFAGNKYNNANNYVVAFGSDQGGTTLMAGDQCLRFMTNIDRVNHEELTLVQDSRSFKVYLWLQDYGSDGTYGGPLTFSAASRTTSGGKVDILGVNNIDGNSASSDSLKPMAAAAMPTGNLTKDGMQLVELYNNANYPTTYGNIINVQGATHKGAGQLLLGWSGSNNGIAGIYYRNKRDNITTWSAWKELSFSDHTHSYLPLAGGSMTGQITSSVSSAYWVDIAAKSSIIASNNTSGAYGWLSGYTKSYRVMLGAYPGYDEMVQLYSYTKARASAGGKANNTPTNYFTWNAATGEIRNSGGATLSSTLNIAPGAANNYSEGIRIQKASNNWATIVLGCKAGTVNGAPSANGGWFIGNNTSNQLIINNVDSGTTNASIWVDTDKSVNFNGSAKFANQKWNVVGNDVKFGDYDVGGCLCLISNSTKYHTGVVMYKTGETSVGEKGNFIKLQYDGTSLNSSKAITTPTPATGDSSTKVATTAFVKAQGYATATNVNNITNTVNQKLGPFDYSKKVSIPKPSSGDDIYNPPSAGIVICSIGYGTIVIDSINYLDGVDFCSKHVRDTYTVPAQPGKPIKFTGRSWGYFIPCKV